MTTKPDSHMTTEPKLPLDSEKMPSRETATLEEKKPRPWHGGPPPHENQHPEIAARVLELWAGGKRKGGLSREYIMWLRGDAPLSAFDGYLHLNPDDVRRAYLACIPRLGV